MLPELQEYINNLPALPAESRQTLLAGIAGKIAGNLQEEGQANLLFVCTHNSRRSHLARIWAEIFAWEAGLTGLGFFSAGTEATAFHPNALAALGRAGMLVISGDGPNPVCLITPSFDRGLLPIDAFSKRFDHLSIPKENLIALMVCSDAEQNCPFIPGAALRLPLTYHDPKEADSSPREQEAYDDACLQIALEMRFLMREIGRLLA